MSITDVHLTNTMHTHEPNLGIVQAAERSDRTILQCVRLSGSDWDAAAAKFDGIAQEQLYAFAQSRWPGVNLEPMLFLDNGRVVGGTMIMVQALPLNMSQIAVCKWGPVLADNLAPDRDSVYAAMIDVLMHEYADKRGMMISVLPRATPAPANFACEILQLKNFSSGSSLMFPNRYFVNLGLDDDAMRKSFAQKWRYHLNKSMKANLSFEHATPDRLGEFDALYEAMTDRKKFADHSAYDTIQSMFDTKIDSAVPELFFVREGSDVIGGAITFKAGDTAVYLYGATNARALPLRAGYFMQWQVMRWLRDNTNARWYDLGGTDGFQGLHQFKKGMVGTQGHIQPVPPIMNYASHLKARLIGNAAYGARDGLQKVRHLIEKYRADLATPDQSRSE